ncbi:MAG: fluoride efflux transporter CrcB [PVC group bacterium]|nr:fluoride efflux transporter CrcB [PVC group bacterium]
MKNIFIVGIGGFIGAVCRYKLGGLILHHSLNWKFPVSTFLINVIGCLIMGVIAGTAERFQWFGPGILLLLMTGVLGGFTTFSAFGYETIFLIRKGEVLIAGSYVGLSVIMGLIAVFVGMKLGGI